MRSITIPAILAALTLSACTINVSSDHSESSQSKTIEKQFASGGKIEMQLNGGAYEIRPAAGNRIRFTSSGNIGNVKTDLMTDGSHATLIVKDTPHNNFTGVIEVPGAADLTVRLTGGELQMSAIKGNKDIQSTGGNMEISVGDPNDYASVDASLKAGNLEAGPFGEAKSGLFPHFTWSGPGKYKLRVDLGAGNLELKK